MPRRIIQLLILLLLFPLAVQAERWEAVGALVTHPTIIEGQAREYAGETLTFRQTVDYITNFQEPVGKTVVGPDGKFKCVLSITQPQLINLETGVYSCYLYAEPGETIRIALPPHKPKTEAERLNPFFERTDVHLRNLNNDKGLNARIAQYEGTFGNAMDQVLVSKRGTSTEQSPNVDSLVAVVAAMAKEGDKFFPVYTRYRTGMFEYLAGTRKAKSINDTYFRNQPIQYGNPAYMDLFNVTYDRYFVYHGRTEDGRQIYKAISKDKSLSELKRVLRQNDNLTQDEILELVILKGLHDEFFRDNFKRDALTIILDSLQRHTRYPEHVAIAQHILERVTKLLPGFIPRAFTLEDRDGKPVSLHQFRGKMVLLCFCTTTSYTCIQEFNLLERFHQQFGDHLAIVCVCADQKFETMANFLRHYDYPWTFLYYGKDPELITEYDIRAYPTYFLLDPDGRLIYSPAPSPSENLGELIARQFQNRDWRIRPLPSNRSRR